MKKVILLFLIAPFVLYAQIGINTTSPKAALDIDMSTLGVLVPRVALSKINTALPVTNPNGSSLVNSTLVYNTQNVNNVTEGFYYWVTDHWERMGANTEYLTFVSIALPMSSGINSDTDFGLGGSNYNANVFRLTHSGADLDGIAGGIHGRVIHLYNGDSSSDLKLVSEGSSASLPKNKFLLQNDVVLKPGNAIIVFYDNVYAKRWIVVRSDN